MFHTFPSPMDATRKLQCLETKAFLKGVKVLNKVNKKKHLNLGHNVSFSRSREADLVERLDGLVSIPQEWHKKKVSEIL